MKKIEDLNYYELLEISTSASPQEIHKAYERVRKVYDPNSNALYSLFSAAETTAIQQRIEEAYRTLLYEENRRTYDARLRGLDEVPKPAPSPRPSPKYQPQPVQPSLNLLSENRYVGKTGNQTEDARDKSAPAEPVSSVSQFIAEFTGSAIRTVREQQGFTLRNIADNTKIGVRYLELIEEENFEKLPVRAYTRGFLILYAKALGCDSERLSGDYLKRFDAARAPKK